MIVKFHYRIDVQIPLGSDSNFLNSGVRGQIHERSVGAKNTLTTTATLYRREADNEGQDVIGVTMLNRM